jgi:glycosyltransferase involved in cell wall biosynthesis
MHKKNKLIVIFPNVLGGVSSFNANLINSKSRLRDEFEIDVILLQDLEDTRPNYNGEINAESITFFKYSSKENQYFVCKRLNKLFVQSGGDVLCDHHLVLNTLSCFKYEKRVFHLLHDFYYVEQNLRFPNTIDYCIAHSSFFSDCILAWNSKDYFGRSKYIPYGVTIPKDIHKPLNDKLKLVFLGRLTQMKGADQLLQIQQELEILGTEVEWTIIGRGDLEVTLKQSWSAHDNVRFIQPVSNIELYKELLKQDLLVFPTLFEGTPVSIFEALANGVVPIVNNLPGGIQDHVKPGIGFTIDNDPKQFARVVSELNNNRKYLFKLQNNCFEYSKSNLDIDLNMNRYFEFFKEKSNTIYPKKKFDMPAFSRLDKQYIPNFAVKLMRSII